MFHASKTYLLLGMTNKMYVSHNEGMELLHRGLANWNLEAGAWVANNDCEFQILEILSLSEA